MEVELYSSSSPLYEVCVYFSKEEILYQLGKETGVVDPRDRPNLFQEVIIAFTDLTGRRDAIEDYMDDPDFLAGQAVVHIIPEQMQFPPWAETNDPFGDWSKRNRSEIKL